MNQLNCLLFWQKKKEETNWEQEEITFFSNVKKIVLDFTIFDLDVSLDLKYYKQYICNGI